jgi:hypothetical protein
MADSELVQLIGSTVGVVAVATRLCALRRMKRGAANKRGMAIIGIVLGMLSILIGAGCWPVKEHTGPDLG